MFKCTGICSQCGRCKIRKGSDESAHRKESMLVYPADFIGDVGQGLGAAFDIGTTTVVGMLWDLKEAEQLAAVAKANPQVEFGADVISRIAYCGSANSRLCELRRIIIKCINEMLVELCEKAHRQVSDIDRITVCGNTTMSHIFAGYSPKTLAMAPFMPAYEGMLQMKATDGLAIDGDEIPALHSLKEQVKLKKEARLTVLPSIAGHVGGDITAGIIAAEVLKGGLTVFMDIGTNGEIVLADGDNVIACSTAVGPALEGAAIKHGMRADAGAIERVRIIGDRAHIETVGERPAVGICGSGLIDAIAQMLDSGVIDETGRILGSENRELVRGEGADRRVVLQGEVAITQKDIRQVQMAKAAIAAGVQLLLRRAGKSTADIDRLIIAGAFGNYIDIDSALRIGLIPKVPREKISSVGNAAGAGVSMALVSHKAMKMAEQIPHIVQHVELASESDFQDVYLREMYFYD